MLTMKRMYEDNHLRELTVKVFDKEHTAFVLVDVQGKLAKLVHDSDALLNNLERLINGLRILNIPIVWLEQYPKGLGRTVNEVARHLSGLQPISKVTFNACKNKTFMQAVQATGRKQIIVAGIETHICVYQTAVGLKEWGYDVQVVEDAVSSRTRANKIVGLEKMKSFGILGTSVEMILYELMESAETDVFKQILPYIK